MTVGELKAELDKFPDDKAVVTMNGVAEAQWALMVYESEPCYDDVDGGEGDKSVIIIDDN